MGGKVAKPEAEAPRSPILQGRPQRGTLLTGLARGVLDADQRVAQSTGHSTRPGTGGLSSRPSCIAKQASDLGKDRSPNFLICKMGVVG